jgi:GrpB-like predicted nucleotidyltransferase (UPF0157 family)
MHKSEVMHWLCKPSPALRTYHLHLVPFRSPLWTEQLVFRDYLRAHPNVAREYAALKYSLPRTIDSIAMRTRSPRPRLFSG